MNDKHFHTVIHAKLAQLAASTPRPLWSEAWSHLRPESSPEECLAVYQAIRDAGSVPEDAGFYLVSWQIDAIVLSCIDVELKELQDRITAIEQAHGLSEDGSWSPGEEPPEYREAMRRYHAAWDALTVARMKAFGEDEMAALYCADREHFKRRNAAGRRFFHGPDLVKADIDLGWLSDLLATVTGCVEAESPMGPMGISYSVDEDFWDVQAYPTPVEVVGGAQDGAVVCPGFLFDLAQLSTAFDSFSDLGWNALGLNDLEGPYVYIEGTYKGHEVYLQILAHPPEGEEPGLKIDGAQGRR